MDLSKFTQNADGDRNIIPDDLVNELLSKYGPEGAYELADKLVNAADKDINDALNDFNTSNNPKCDIYPIDRNPCDRFRFNGEIACKECSYKIKNKEE